MNLTNRFFIYAPFALFVVLFAGLSIRWWIVAEEFAKSLDGMNGRQIAPGVMLHFASKRVAGFPFRLDAIFKDLRIDVTTPHGPASWRTADFALHRLTYGADQTIYEAAGKQVLTWTDDMGRSHALPFAVGSMHASSIIDVGALSRLDVEIVNVGSEAFTAAGAQLHIRHDPATDALDLYLDANDVHLAPRNASSFGNQIGLLTLQATVAPGKSFDALARADQTWFEALDEWRRAAGSAHVDALQVDFGRMSAMGTGALAFDLAKRPSGVLDFKIAGISHFLQQAATRAINGGSDKGLGPALIDRSRKAGSDEMGRVGVVMGFKDGVVYAGDEPAGTIGPLY